MSPTLALACMLTALPAAAQTVSVACHEGLVSLTADQAPLGQVLSALARETGLTVVGLDQVRGIVTLTLANQPLAAALDQLLEGMDYVRVGARTASSSCGFESGSKLWLRGPRKAQSAAPQRSLTREQQALEGTLPMLRSSADVTADPEPDATELERQREAEFLDTIGADALPGASSSESGAVRVRALRELTVRDPTSATDVLAAALDDAEPSVRAHALELLGESADPNATDRLVSLLQSDREADRDMAVRALGLRIDTVRTDALTSALSDPSPGIRRLVRELLARNRAAASR